MALSAALYATSPQRRCAVEPHKTLHSSAPRNCRTFSQGVSLSLLNPVQIQELDTWERTYEMLSVVCWFGFLRSRESITGYGLYSRGAWRAPIQHSSVQYRQRYVYCGKQRSKIPLPRLLPSVSLHLLFAKSPRSVTVFDRQEASCSSGLIIQLCAGTLLALRPRLISLSTLSRPPTSYT